jgi:hypothetical protein
MTLLIQTSNASALGHAGAAFLNHLQPAPEAGTLRFRPIANAWLEPGAQPLGDPLEAPRLLTPESYETFRPSALSLFRIVNQIRAEMPAVWRSLFSVADSRSVTIRSSDGGSESIQWVLETDEDDPGTPLFCSSSAGKSVDLFLYPDLELFEDVTVLSGGTCMALNLSEEGSVLSSLYGLDLAGREIETARTILNRAGASLFELGLEVANLLTGEGQYAPAELGGKLSLLLTGPRRILPLRWRRDHWNLPPQETSPSGKTPPQSFQIKSTREKTPFRIIGVNSAELRVSLPSPYGSEKPWPLAPSLHRLWEAVQTRPSGEEPEPERPTEFPELGFLTHLRFSPERGIIEYRPLLIEWANHPGITPEEMLGPPVKLTEHTAKDLQKSLRYLIDHAPSDLNAHGWKVFEDERGLGFESMNRPLTLILSEKRQGSLVEFAEDNRGATFLIGSRGPLWAEYYFRLKRAGLEPLRPHLESGILDGKFKVNFDDGTGHPEEKVHIEIRVDVRNRPRLLPPLLLRLWEMAAPSDSDRPQEGSEG